MINLHVYPSPITNESRIEREVETIHSLGIFSSVEVAGVSAPGLSEVDPLGSAALIRRFGAEPDSHGLLSRVGKTVGLSRGVLKHYSSEPVAVINCHSVAALPACVALKRKTGARLVYDTHELETETSAAVGLRRYIYKTAESKGIRHVDHTFTVSKSIEDWYRAEYGLTDIDTIYNFPSGSQTAADRDGSYFRRLFQIPPSLPIYLYQGVLGPGRGIELLLEAFGRERVDGVVVFLGFGPMEEMIRREALKGSRIFHHPVVSPSRLGELTAAADVGLALTLGTQSLSYYYSAPNKLFQCWRAGLPVIGVRLPEFERFFSRYPAGTMMSANTVDSFVEACQELSRMNPVSVADALEEANRDLRWESYTELFRSRYERLTDSWESR